MYYIFMKYLAVYCRISMDLTPHQIFDQGCVRKQAVLQEHVARLVLSRLVLSQLVLSRLCK